MGLFTYIDQFGVFFFYFGATVGVLMIIPSCVLRVDSWQGQGCTRDEPELAMCKASDLSTILSLWPQSQISVCLFLVR